MGLLVLVSAAYVRLWRRHRHDKGNLRLLFDAVENADYTLRFTEGGKRNNSVNHWLNRIKEVLQRARDEQMERERYFEMVLNATDTGLMVVDERDNILLHNQAAMQLLHTDILTHMSQIPAQRLTDERLARHETTTTLRGKRVRIVALSNVEGELINKLQEVGFSADGIVLNAGAYTHTSVALHDCIRAIKSPVVEVHISNVHQREEFRRHSFISPACKGVICGFGLDSYRLAIEGLTR